MDQNGITFNDVTTGTLKFGNLPLSPSHGNGLDEDGYGIINAVDIDWNEADLQAKLNSMQSVEEGLQHYTIKSTGELIDEIVHLRAEVNALTSLVKGLYAALSV